MHLSMCAHLGWPTSTASNRPTSVATTHQVASPSFTALRNRYHARFWTAVSGRRPEAIAAEFGEVSILGTPFHTTPTLFTALHSPQALYTKV